MSFDILLLYAVRVIGFFLSLLYYSIFIWVILSWVQLFFERPKTKFEATFDQIVMPMLAPFRWARLGMFDLSPIIVILLLSFAVHDVLPYIEHYIRTQF